MRLQDGTCKVTEAAGARWWFYPRIIFGFYGRIIFILVILLAPCIVNDALYIRRINHEIHFVLQA